jgi:hypothetical protein
VRYSTNAKKRQSHSTSRMPMPHALRFYGCISVFKPREADPMLL